MALPRVILMGFAFIIGEILSGKSNGILVDFLIAAPSLTRLIRRRRILAANYLITTHFADGRALVNGRW